MSSSPLLSFILATHLREEDAAEAIDSILAQEYSPIEVIVVSSPVGNTYCSLNERYADDSRVEVILEEERRGPPVARNIAFAEASGDIFVSLDDDAVFRDTDAAEHIVEAFEANPSVGFLAFRSEDYETGEVIPHEIPKGPNGRQPDEPHRTTYFVGVGAAFRAEAVSATEGYAEDFYYQMEELDFSFQMLRAGYFALYLPHIVVRHKHAEAGRPSDAERWSRLLDNRLRVAIRHLPIWCIVSSAIIWTGKALSESRSPGAVVDAFRRVFADRDALCEQREVIDRPTRRSIARLNGRIWY